MNKRTKIWIIAASSLIVLGCIMFASVMTAFNWDFTKLSTVKYETNTYYLTDDFDNISIKDNTADISFVPSVDGEIKVVCYEEINARHSVSVENGTLSIELVNYKKWYEYIGISFESPKVIVYIPEGDYGKLEVVSSTSDVTLKNNFKFESISVSLSTGKITLESLTANSIDVKTSTGKTEMSNITCNTLTTNGSTGDIFMKDVLVKGKISVKRSTGDVTFENCDASEIFIKTDTGDVNGSLLSDKVFIAKTDTGRIDVPKTVTGGRCEITTDTGNIKISVNYRTDPA